MNSLYPLRFKPSIKEKVWGGSRLKTVLNKDVEGIEKAGESWEISGVEGDISIVENGYLKDNTIEELIEIYMGDLVGDSVYEKFGVEFPLLIKFIDSNDFLSIQVHPNDDLARVRHNSYGKTEMWYVLDSNPDSELILGFNQDMDKHKYLKHVVSSTFSECLNFETVKKGDAFFVPSGKVHSIGPGNLIAEIQQTSDITYRISDWNRVDKDGESRELHTELAVDAINYSDKESGRIDYSIIDNQSAELVSCEYFKTNVLQLTKSTSLDYNSIDSFIIYMALEGDVELIYSKSDDPMIIKMGQTVLLPAVIVEVEVAPVNASAKILEVYIK